MINIFCDLEKSTRIIVNQRINDYLDIYMTFYRDLGPEEGFRSLFPPMIWIEDDEKCIKTMIELDVWTRDEYLHHLKPIHEFALYQVLCQTNNELTERGEVVQETHDEDITEDEYILSNPDNIDFYLDILFQDHDFLWVADYLDEFFNNPINFVENRDVDLDDYLDLMPTDIREGYRSIKNSLYPANIKAINRKTIHSQEDFLEHIESIINYYVHSITLKDAYKLLWNDNDLAKKEKSAQQLFNFMSGIYCEDNNIDITPEAETGRGPVDFKFSFGNAFKTLVEIKLASNDLVKGLKNQTVQYMKSERVDHAYYLVILMHDEEQNKIEKLIENADEISSNSKFKINTIIIDARRTNKPSASKIR
ncbi:hypothetical protein NYE54_14210 [Paenibacillus sp. FSL K6-1330]|uniref:hypothetical protein n=1 Tax=Paenibacillus sp. FSL K6-1330 TaxID=2975292 RepID=UPI0030DBA6F8